MIFEALLVILIAFLGFPLGILLGKMTSDEVKDKVGLNYLYLLRWIILISISLTFVFFSLTKVLLLVPSILMVFVLFFHKKKVIWPVYFLSSIYLLYYLNLNFMFLLSIFNFVLLLVKGSIHYSK